MTDQQPHTPPECDHHWISYMQPSAGLSWIRQCSQCRDFDADDLQEQIAAAEQRGAIKALRGAASSGLFVGPIADLLENRADLLEGDDEKH
ncbi:MAG: hypothetical protein L0J69_00160 [Yaniella sp.]|nr:hypothetical protein [Yaniella sp.]